MRSRTWTLGEDRTSQAQAAAIVLGWIWMGTRFFGALGRHYNFFTARAREARLLIDGPCRDHGATITGTYIDCHDALRITSSYVPPAFLAVEHAVHDTVMGFFRGAVLELSQLLRLVGMLATMGLTAVAVSNWTANKVADKLFVAQQQRSASEMFKDMQTMRLAVNARSFPRIPRWADSDEADDSYMEKID